MSKTIPGTGAGMSCDGGIREGHAVRKEQRALFHTIRSKEEIMYFFSPVTTPVRDTRVVILTWTGRGEKRDGEKNKACKAHIDRLKHRSQQRIFFVSFVSLYYIGYARRRFFFFISPRGP